MARKEEHRGKEKVGAVWTREMEVLGEGMYEILQL
jgi:hypothetical protein